MLLKADVNNEPCIIIIIMVMICLIIGKVPMPFAWKIAAPKIIWSELQQHFINDIGWFNENTIWTVFSTLGGLVVDNCIKIKIQG